MPGIGNILHSTEEFEKNLGSSRIKICQIDSNLRMGRRRLRILTYPLEYRAVECGNIPDSLSDPLAGSNATSGVVDDGAIRYGVCNMAYAFTFGECKR